MGRYIDTCAIRVRNIASVMARTITEGASPIGLILLIDPYGGQSLAYRRSDRGGEADCVIGKGRQGVFATLAERKSRLYLALRTKNKTAKETNAAILMLLKHMKQHVMKQHVMTLTFDNGREFCWHSELAKQLECETYFAKPYHSWERGLNAK